MMTLELDDETAALLNELAAHEHITPVQLLKNLALVYRNTRQAGKHEAPELLTDFAGLLSHSPSFKGDPLAIQQAMRDEWS